MKTLEGTLKHITFQNKQNFYTVARLKIASPKTTVTVVGCLPEAVIGETIKLTGKWITHAKFGQQFKFETAETLLPATIDGIMAYLTSGFLKGIGPSTANKIVGCFGAQTFDVIENNPEKLTKIDGIGSKKATSIHEQWKSQNRVKTIMNFLQEHGVNTSYSGKILELYGDKAIDIICQSPYCLANDISGIDFYIADKMAQNLGVETDIAERTDTCVRYLLKEALKNGHVFVYKNDLFQQINTFFEITHEEIDHALDSLAENGEISIETLNNDENDQAVYLKKMFQAEKAIAARIHTLLSIPTDPISVSNEKLLTEIENKLIIALSAEQCHVLKEILKHRISIITGGPGTGKTTLIKSITTMYKTLGKRVCLAAPTGRAARRLSEVTKTRAHTIHKLLEYKFDDQSFGKDQDDPIDADIIIIDEASMVDTILMYHLLNAISFSSSVIMVGDAHQLPPVGPGNMLSDMIEAETIPAFYLNTIFRQAQESPIIVNAHCIRNGDFPQLNSIDDDLHHDTEFYFIEKQTPEDVVSCIIDMCTQKLPEKFGLDPIEDIQVLSPMHKGVAGTINLNKELQARLNKHTNSLSHDNFRFKQGDKVMHLKNNYQKEVFNGDIGAITAIDKSNELLTVNYYGRNVDYGITEMDELSLGYAISVHKSQGSEYPAVILPLITQQYVMLQRNLLYTAITRAQKLVVLIGSKQALAIALKNKKPQMRRSGLINRLIMMACGSSGF